MVRLRAAVVLPGLVAFTLLGSLADSQFWRQWWFYVGLVTAIAFVFVEPYFSRPQDGIVNGLGGVAAYVSATRPPIEGLWIAYLLFSVVVGLAAAVAALMPVDSPAPAKWLSYRLAQSFGKAVVIGPAALFLEVVGRSARSEHGYESLAFATAALVLGLGVNWRLLIRTLSSQDSAAVTTVAAFGPRLLLVSAPSLSLVEGSAVRIAGRVGDAVATVLGRLPHADGQRYQLALAEDWQHVVASFPEQATIEMVDADEEIVGAAGEGSTDRALHFEPLRPLPVGAPLSVGGCLYQVAAIELRRSAWAGSSAVVRHAVARQVGRVQSGRLTATPMLPLPHEPVMLPDYIAAELPPGYLRIGVLQGTGVPIGLALVGPERGHIAILGMSGTGKTAVAHRIGVAMGSASLVIAVDITGEYRSRLGYPTWTQELNVLGHAVWEPGGEPSLEVCKLIRNCMSAGAQEYSDPHTQCVPRVILLEEAHSFIPEWNFAGRNQQDNVNSITRMIMQARKYALTFVVVSQRTAVVSKSALR